MIGASDRPWFLYPTDNSRQEEEKFYGDKKLSFNFFEYIIASYEKWKTASYKLFFDFICQNMV